MERLSPKIEIINYFDNLINRIDIDIDSSLEKYNDKQLISEIVTSSDDNRQNFGRRYFDLKFFDTFYSSKPNLESWPESTKVVDYLKQIRMKTIEELKNAQEEAIEYYKLNSERFKSELTNEKSIEDLKSELFAEKFYFQVNFEQSKNRLWPFNVFTFVTNFYISPSDIHSLEKKLINYDTEPFDQDGVFDDKMVLTSLLFKCFINNLLNFPNHVIHVRKEDILNIESIEFKHEYSGVNLTNSSTIDLSKLEKLDLFDRYCGYRRELVKFKIEGLCSLKTLKLGAITDKLDFSIKNLPSLSNMALFLSVTIDEDIVTRLFDQVSHIQELHLNGNLCYFNLDNLVNLRVLSLSGRIDEKFNFELFKNLCNQLEVIKISIYNIKEEIFFKLFDGYNFPYLADLTIAFLYMIRLKKQFINRLPKTRRLNVTECEIEEIESDSFSNMQQLTSLNLSRNQIEFIEKNTFSNLKKLQSLDLSDNRSTNFDPTFIGLRESVELKIENNRI